MTCSHWATLSRTWLHPHFFLLWAVPVHLGSSKTTWAGKGLPLNPRQPTSLGWVGEGAPYAAYRVGGAFRPLRGGYLVEPIVVCLDAHAVQDLFDVLGAGGGIAPKGGQQVWGNVTHLSGGRAASLMRPRWHQGRKAGSYFGIKPVFVFWLEHLFHLHEVYI